MFTQSKKMLLCLFMGVLCISSYLGAEEDTVQGVTVDKKNITSFAETMEVFPLDIITDGGYPFRGGPLTRRGRAWFKRYELTFEHYHRFYEFKEFALSISEKDFIKTIEGFESATPKEKALMMTMIYIYERTYRKRTLSHKGSVYTRHSDKCFFRFDNKKTIIFGTRWNEWVSLIESHKDDPTVAFPAVVTDEKILKEKWKEDRKKTIQQLDNLASSLGLSELCEQLHSVLFVREDDTFPVEEYLMPIRFLDILYNEYDYEKMKPIEVFAEFLSWQHGPLVQLAFGTMPPMGNSSAKPKTLGDIATQILKSRLSYEEE